jgi:hypothetical protein
MRRMRDAIDDANTNLRPVLDRRLQRTILVACRAHFPRFHRLDEDLRGEDPARVAFQCFYLADHGLIEIKPKSNEHPWPACKITADGIDHLEDDGGLGAILGVVTVKLHNDTIRALLIERVEQAPGDPSMKAALTDAIRKLPAETLKSATMQLVTAGISSLALPAIKALVA